MQQLKPDKLKFVKTYLENGFNGTQAVMSVYGVTDPNYAAVKANRLIRNDKVAEVIEDQKKRLDEFFPDDYLARIHREGLHATRAIFKNNNATKKVEHVGDEPDYAVIHKYLDSAYKIKGSYAPEKRQNLNVNVDVPSDRVKHLAKKLNS